MDTTVLPLHIAAGSVGVITGVPPAVAPLIALFYWIWRVRIRKSMRGLLTSRPLSPGAPRVAAEPAGD